MPHTMPSSFVENHAVHPPLASSDNTTAYTTGDTLPAFHEDTSAPVSGAASPIGAKDGSPPTAADIHSATVDNLDRSPRSRSRTRELIGRVSRSISRDPFFHRDSEMSQEDQIKATALAEAHRAQDSTEAGDIDRATRSTSRSREFVRSVSRSLSRDPFFKRGTGENQVEEQKLENQREASRSRVAYDAGVADREKSKSRSRSRARAPAAPEATS